MVRPAPPRNPRAGFTAEPRGAGIGDFRFGRRRQSRRPARKNQSWEFGPFVNWGTGLGNRDNFNFFSLVFRAAKFSLPSSCRTPQRPIPTWGQHHAASGRPIPRRLTSKRFFTPADITWPLMAAAPSPEPASLPSFFVGIFSPGRTLPALVSRRRRSHLHHPQVPAGSARAPRQRRRHFGLQLFPAGRRRRPLFPSPRPVHRPGHQRRPHLFGFAGRQKSRRQCQHSNPGRLYLLEMSSFSSSCSRAVSIFQRANRSRHRVRAESALKWSGHERAGGRMRTELL